MSSVVKTTGAAPEPLGLAVCNLKADKAGFLHVYRQSAFSNLLEVWRVKGDQQRELINVFDEDEDASVMPSIGFVPIAKHKICFSDVADNLWQAFLVERSTGICFTNVLGESHCAQTRIVYFGELGYELPAKNSRICRLANGMFIVITKHHIDVIDIINRKVITYDDAETSFFNTIDDKVFAFARRTDVGYELVVVNGETVVCWFKADGGEEKLEFRLARKESLLSVLLDAVFSPQGDVVLLSIKTWVRSGNDLLLRICKFDVDKVEDVFLEELNPVMEKIDRRNMVILQRPHPEPDKRDNFMLMTAFCTDKQLLYSSRERELHF
jgi:hypothetical protein